MTRSFESHLALAESSARPFGATSITKDDWAEPEELVGFKAADNEIRELDIEIGAFGALKSIDVSRRGGMGLRLELRLY